MLCAVFFGFLLEMKSVLVSAHDGISKVGQSWSYSGQVRSTYFSKVS